MTERTRALVPVRQEDAEALAALGREIWEEHYTSLLGPEQVAYMVEKFQSAPAVRRHMQEDGPGTGFSRWTAKGPDMWGCSPGMTVLCT